MVGLGFPEDSLQILQEGERLSKELDDERSLAKFYSNIALCYTFRGDPLQGIKYAGNAFEEAEKAEDIELMARTGWDICLSYLIAGEPLKIAKVAPKVIALLEKTQRQSESFSMGFHLYSALLSTCGHAMGWIGDFGHGECLCEKGLRFALETNNLINIGFAECQYGWLFIHRGDGKNAVEHFQNSTRYCEEAQLLALLGNTWAGSGWGYYLLGELKTAQEHTERGIKIKSEWGIPVLLTIPYRVLGMVYLDSRDLQKAQSCMEQSIKQAQDSDAKSQEMMSRVFLGRILGKADKSQHNKAERCIQQGIKILDELRIRPYSAQGRLFLGELYADMGQREKALENLKKAEVMMQDMGMDYWLRRTQEVLERVEG
jgi:tetratricopeptide (TPR) repeat protein